MRTIDLLDNGMSREPDRACVLDVAPPDATTPPLIYTHDEVRILSHQIANGLKSVGITRGSRVAVYSGNCAMAMICMVGLLRSGAVWLPVNTRNPLADNIDFLKDNHCEFVFCEGSLLTDLVKIRAVIPSIREAVLIGTAPMSSANARWLTDWAAQFPDVFPDDEHGPDDLAWIKGTGGTTGRPKNVMIPHRSAVALLATSQICFANPEPLVNLVAAPITHGAGNFALAILSAGGTSVVITRPEPLTVLDAIETHRISTLMLPPTIVYNLLAHPGVGERDFSSLRYFAVGAAPISPDRLAQAIDVFGPVMCQIWGQTEAPMILAFMAPAEYGKAASYPEILKSCGRATPLTRIEVMDDDGKLLPNGDAGELVVRGDLVMSGYYEHPEDTSAASHFGWHHTGDIGYRDSKGYIYIVDRKKDMIISGGFNIYPSEIEQVLWRHDSVLDCAVIGVPDSKWGESVKAVVELKSGHTTTEQDLQAFCRAHLGGMKTPKSFEIWPTLPRSAVGKVLKRQIRERYWEGRERQI